jgi:GT2 family glycosyltransferase
MNDCDVVIVNYNAGKLLSSCVASAVAEEAGRVIVVDNASIDQSLVELQKNFPAAPWLRIFKNDKNLGFAKGCNIGARSGNGRYLLFLNPDSILESGALARMIAVLENHDSIGMVGGFLCGSDGLEQPGARRVFPTPRRAFLRAFGLSRLAKFFPGLLLDFLLHREPLPSTPVPVEAISGACMLVKRDAVADVGLWDEGYFLHCEDLDWCMRFRQKGWKILFVPDAKVVHHKGGCSHSCPIFVEWHKHRGMVRFYRKFFRHQYPGVLMWLVVLGVWVRFGMLATYLQGRRVLGRHARDHG